MLKKQHNGNRTQHNGNRTKRKNENHQNEQNLKKIPQIKLFSLLAKKVTTNPSKPRLGAVLWENILKEELKTTEFSNKF